MMVSGCVVIVAGCIGVGDGHNGCVGLGDGAYVGVGGWCVQ